MKIGGLQRISLIDYPGYICAIIFSQGCNFKCPYCHNPELVDRDMFRTAINENDVIEFLESRKGKLDAVTLCGGEPTMQSDVISFIKKIKKMGFAVKLDTNGSLPQVIKALLDEQLIDYVAMDVKAPLDKYKDIVKTPVNQDSIRESIQFILKAKIPHEFRTTLVQSQLDEDDILQIGKMINGASHYVLQNFIPTKTLDKKFTREKSFPDEKLQQIKNQLEQQIPTVTIR
ncbi:MAG TPA: anaerobic ribonucleoside-triphosphate reductase activating protein [Smithella sp.]|mgnify:CR=1 FL=1|nr:anaerobic ribonucleoside-triphosphate reductase activating protein [Smithella sp.]